MPGERVLIEGWPTLLTPPMAARYLALDDDTFRALMVRHRVHPVEPSPGELRWKRTDLDALVKRLPAVPPLHVVHGRLGIGLSDETVERIAAAIVGRLSERPANDPRALLSIKDAIELLGVGRSTVYKLIGDGRLQTRRIGNRTLIPRGSLEALLAGASWGADSARPLGLKTGRQPSSNP